MVYLCVSMCVCKRPNDIGALSKSLKIFLFIPKNNLRHRHVALDFAYRSRSLPQIIDTFASANRVVVDAAAAAIVAVIVVVVAHCFVVCHGAPLIIYVAFFVVFI